MSSSTSGSKSIGGLSPGSAAGTAAAVASIPAVAAAAAGAAEGDWICPEPECANLNFARRTACNRCGKDKPVESSKKKCIGIEIGKAAAEKSRGLFSADDWQCTKCGNVNWARRSSCNVCNAPKFKEVEERTGYGGGYNDRGVVEYKERAESDDEYDEFGRKKKKFRKKGPDCQSGDEDALKSKNSRNDEDDEEDEEEDDDDDSEDGDLSKYDLSDWGVDKKDDDQDKDKKAKAEIDEKKTDGSVVEQVKSGKSTGNRRSRSRSISSRSRSSKSSSSSSRSSSRSRGRRRSKGKRSRSRSRSRGRRSRSRSRDRRRSSPRNNRKSRSSRSRSKDRRSSRRSRSPRDRKRRSRSRSRDRDRRRR